MESTGAIDVYFEEEIEILMPGNVGELSESEVEELLEEHELDFSTIERCASSG